MKPMAGVILTKCPQDWQIIQRSGAGVGEIQLEGTWSTFDWFPKDTVCTVQARVVNELTNAPVTNDLDWQDAEIQSESQQFEITLRDIPQGGLYRIETRIRRTHSEDRRGLRGDCVHHIGVGDIYVIAGQSNASGTGKGHVQDGPELGVHLFANDENWKLAIHPIEDSTNSLHPITMTGINHGHSPWLAFGKVIYQKTGIPIGLIPTALGGSSISRWAVEDHAPGDLFINMRDMIERAGGKIAGVLWYQGESDTNADGVKFYQKRFESFVSTLRTSVGNDKVPVLIGQLNRWIDSSADDDCWSAIRELQRKASMDLEHVYMIPTIDCSLSDAIHNSSQSNVIIGQRFAETALGHIFRQSVASGFPTLTSVQFADGDQWTIVLRFEHVSGEWMTTSERGDFTVVDEVGIIPIRSLSLEPNHSVRLVLERAAVENTIVHGLYGANPQISLRDDMGRCIVPFSVRCL